MVGLSSLTKVLRRLLGPRFESSGLLPRRYYLLRALEALHGDDIDEAVRMISLAVLGSGGSAKWRLVCQQVIFRCRVLAALHERRLERIRLELEKADGVVEIRNRYLSLQKAEGRARTILKGYERRLLGLLARRGPVKPTSP
jgi:hypothetical protein